MKEFLLRAGLATAAAVLSFTAVRLALGSPVAPASVPATRADAGRAADAVAPVSLAPLGDDGTARSAKGDGAARVPADARTPGTNAARGGVAAAPEPTPGTVICGFTRDQEGGAIPFADVWVLGPAGRLHVRADQSGRYLLGPMAAATGSIEADARGCNPAERPLDWSAGDPVVRMDLTLTRRRAIDVFCTVAGSDDPGAALRPYMPPGNHPELVPRVTAEEPVAAPGERSLQGRPPTGMATLSRGGFTAPVPPPGTHWLGRLHLLGDDPRWISVMGHGVILAAAPLDPDAQMVTLDLDLGRIEAARGTLSLTAIDGTTAAPIADAEVRWTPYGFPNGRAAGRTGEDGALRITDQLPGTRWVWIEAPGYMDTGQVHTLAPGAELSLGTVALWPPTECTGRVRNPDGLPGEIHVMSAWVDPSTGASHWTSAVAVVDPTDGTFTARVGRGVVRLRAVIRKARQRLAGVSEVLQLDGGAPSNGEVLLTLRGAVRVTADLPAGAALPCEVTVLDEGQREVARALAWADGDARFDLAPGDYVCRWSSPGAEPVQRPFEARREALRLTP